MSQAVQCVCGARFAAQPHLAGKTVACPSCGSPLQIPALRPPHSSAAPTAAVRSLTVSCICGARFAAEPRLAGQRLACPNCGQAISVPDGNSGGLPNSLGYAGLDSTAQDGWQAGSTRLAAPIAPRVHDDEGLTMPIKIAIGVGGSAVLLLLFAVIVSSVLTPAASRDDAPGGRTVTADGTVARETTEPAADSALSSVGNFVSGLMTGTPKTYATPEAVFDAYWRARDNHDMKALFGTIAPDQRELMLANVIHSLAQMRLFDDQVTAGMEKYGLDFQKINISTSSQELRRLASNIENPASFLQAANDRLTEALERMSKENAAERREALEQALQARETREGTPRRQLTAEERARAEKARKEYAKPPRLTDLEITGDRAKGTCVRGGAELNMSWEIEFVKIDGAWYVSKTDM